MSPSRLRLSLGIASLVLLAAILISINSTSLRLPPTVYFLALSANIVLFFIWVGLGKITGLVSSLISAAFIFLLFVKYNIDSEPYYFLSFVAVVFIGYRFANKFFILDQEYKVETERIEEDTNLLKNELNKNRQELEQLDWRLARYSNLSSIIEKFSSSLSRESIIEIIAENTYKIFGKSDRILFFLVDTKKQELELMHSKKIGITPYIKMKNGDIFDRWVFKKRQPLLVQDIYNDFRFSLEDQNLDKGFHSIISAPLMSKDKVLGILRMDSAQKSFYTQEDLRLLDIISDLASVALENAILYRRVSDLAITDGLTSLYVHKYFKERLANEVKRSLKSGKPFSLALLDIDDFKDYNDKYGHTAGDLLLKHISQVLTEDLRGGDIAARYGGEEFALILINKDKAEAVALLDRLRRRIENTPVILRRRETGVTISVGIATSPSDSSLVEDLLRDADRRLYKAKEKGKNQVCAY